MISPGRVSTEEDATSSSTSSSSSDDSTSSCRDAATPQKQKPDNEAFTTPKNHNVSASKTPEGAPAATVTKGLGVVPTGSANRPRRLSQTPKVQPTLLTDFFLGRPSQARIQAQRRKMSDAAAVKAEMRTAMRQSSVLRIQQPGGVHERVKKWQKANAATMARGDPEAEPSEPTDVLLGEDDKSVTEEDRLRIRARQKCRVTKAHVDTKDRAKTDDENNTRPGRRTAGRGDKKSGKSEGDSGSDKDDDTFENARHKLNSNKAPKGRPGLNNGSHSTPRKRIVSDEHWMKRRRQTSPNLRNSKMKPKPGTQPVVATPIPRDFLQRTAQNPTVQNKIRDWAKRVEPPDPKKQIHDNDKNLGHEARARKLPSIRDSELSSEMSKGPSSEGWRTVHDDGIRIRPIHSTRSAKESPSSQQGQQERAANENEEPRRKAGDDGIRVRPAPPSDSTQSLAKVTVPEVEKLAATERQGVPNNGSRVIPSAGTARNYTNKQPRQASATKYTRSASIPSHHGSPPSFNATSTVRSAPTESAQLEESFIHTTESTLDEANTVLGTPTKKPVRRPRPRASTRPPAVRKPHSSPVQTLDDEAETDTCSLQEGSMESRSWSGEDDINESIANSYGPSTIPPKSLADIPVGFSAFSELDLPMQGEAGKVKGRAARRESFKGVPNVLKKVVSEGKKIIHDRVDPPKPVVNQPPSIENWLHDTVDPFIEPAPTRKVSSAQARQSQETQWKSNAQRKSVSESQKRNFEASSTQVQKSRRLSSREESEAKSVELPNETLSAIETMTSATNTTPIKSCSTTTTTTTTTKPEVPHITPKQKPGTTSGLKRSGATRIVTSPLKSDGAKRPFRELLRDAFRGESGTVHKPTTTYPDYDVGKDRYRDRDMYLGTDSEVSYGDTIKVRNPRRRSSDSSSEDNTLTTITRSTESSITASTYETSSFASSATPSFGIPKRRPPPTNGNHELSTIVSVESYSTQPSDTMSTISETTITQDTALSKASRALSRKRSDKSSAGPRYRHIKHPDLVSVLSLPDDSQLPARARSIRRARSLHRKTSNLDNATLDDLLLEFQEDEFIYRRELKTLASGVIPVLLTQFFDENGNRRAADMFCADLDGQKVDGMSRAVVNMGVALEKLSLLHQFVPVTDAPKIVHWLEKVYPIYDNYLDVWRLGFHGIIVNLAPAKGKTPEADSLINVMERNEAGDVLDENGERVDVAYLLRRPLVRIKWMLKFAKVSDMAITISV